MVLMFQREVAQKLMGKPGTKAYGPLAILAQLCAKPVKLIVLGPGAFSPPPKVESEVVRFDPRADAPPLVERRGMLNLLHRGFAQRRKTLANNFSGALVPAELTPVLEAQGLAPNIRAEAIAPAGWLALIHALRATHPEAHARLTKTGTG